MRRVALLVFALVTVFDLESCSTKHAAGENPRKERAAEAVHELKAMGKAIRLYYAETNKLPKGHAALTPGTPCCTHPNQICDPLEEKGTWDGDPWDTLDFVLEERHRFQYDYDSDGTTFTAHAVGDLDCKGDVVTITLTGSIGEDAVVFNMDNPLRADKKAATPDDDE